MSLEIDFMWSISGECKWIKIETHIIFLQLQPHISQFTLKLLPPEGLVILVAIQCLSRTAQLHVGSC